MSQKWWLISDESFRSIQRNLLMVVDQTDDADSLNLLMKDALHTLETGLSQTEEIPRDWEVTEQQVTDYILAVDIPPLPEGKGYILS